MSQAAPRVVESADVALVTSAYPVGFQLLTHGDAQYVAFYDVHRDMTIAKRTLGQSRWQIERIPSDQPSPFGARATPTRTGWDSHNYVVFAFDADGQIHLAGNMHVNPLLYFRTERPGDIASFKRIDYMTGHREAHVTYPAFFRDAEGRLVFKYRDGSSGDGADYFNRYDAATRTWSRLLDTPITDGRTPINGQTAYAYAHGPVLGPDGYFHLIWVWRDTPACETNHSLCYARSRDLLHWEDSAGRPLALPVTPVTSEVVDPVPVKGGMINGNVRIGFDARKRVILSYHKFDAAGNTQIYNVRRESAGWRSAQASRWNYRWDFSGDGSVIFDVRLSNVELAPDGRLRQTWANKQDGPGGAYLDPDTLEPVAPYAPPARFPDDVLKVESDFPGMEVRTSDDRGVSSEPSVRYVLRWETLPQNRDRPVDGPLPAPSMLRVIKIEG